MNKNFIKNILNTFLQHSLNFTTSLILIHLKHAEIEWKSQTPGMWLLNGYDWIFILSSFFALNEKHLIQVYALEIMKKPIQVWLMLWVWLRPFL